MTKTLIAILVFAALAFGQGAGLAPPAKFQGLDNNGQPLAGGLLYTYQAGTSTPLPTYTDSSGSVQNANPVVLDSAGRANVWLGANSYKFILQTSGGSTLWTVDNIVSPVFANYLPLAGGTVTGAILSTGATNLGNTSNPFGTLFLNQALSMSGATVIDSSRNATVQNLTINGTCTGCGSVSGFLPLAGGSMTGNIQLTGSAGITIGSTSVISNNGTNADGAFRNLTVTGTCTGCGGGGGGSFLPLAGGTMTGNISMNSGTAILPVLSTGTNLGDSSHYFGNVYLENLFLYPNIGSMQWGTASNLANLNSAGGATFQSAVTINGALTVASCSGCGGGGGGGTLPQFIATNTGTALTFLNSGGLFQVNGNGALTAVSLTATAPSTNTALSVAGGAWYVNGLGNMVGSGFTNLGSFFNNGNVLVNGTLATTVGFYTYYTGAASASVSCVGISNGWLAMTSDNYIAACIGSTRYRAALTAY